MSQSTSLFPRILDQEYTITKNVHWDKVDGCQHEGSVFPWRDDIVVPYTAFYSTSFDQVAVSMSASRIPYSLKLPRNPN